MELRIARNAIADSVLLESGSVWAKPIPRTARKADSGPSVIDFE
jgi:hypothetical protein